MKRINHLEILPHKFNGILKQEEKKNRGSSLKMNFSFLTKLLPVLLIVLIINAPQAICKEPQGVKTRLPNIKVQRKPGNIGVAFLPHLHSGRGSSGDDAEEKLFELAGELPGVDRIFTGLKTPHALFEKLLKIKQLGKKVDLIVIGGHSPMNEGEGTLRGNIRTYFSPERDQQAIHVSPGVWLMPKDVDIDGKITEAEQACRDKKEASKKKLCKEIEDLQKVGEVMAPNAQILILSCYGAYGEKGRKFMTMLGKVLLSRHGGTIVAPTTPVTLSVVTTAGEALGPSINSGRLLSFGDAFVKASWRKYSIPPNAITMEKPDCCSDWVRTIKWHPNYPPGNVKVGEDRVTFASAIPGYEGRKTVVYFTVPPKRFKLGEKVTLTLKTVPEYGGPMPEAKFRVYGIDSVPACQLKACRDGYSTRYRKQPKRVTNVTPVTQFSYVMRPAPGSESFQRYKGVPVGPQVALDLRCGDSKTPSFSIYWTYVGKGNEQSYNSAPQILASGASSNPTPIATSAMSQINRSQSNASAISNRIAQLKNRIPSSSGAGINQSGTGLVPGSTTRSRIPVNNLRAARFQYRKNIWARSLNMVVEALDKHTNDSASFLKKRSEEIKALIASEGQVILSKEAELKRKGYTIGYADRQKIISNWERPRALERRRAVINVMVQKEANAAGRKLDAIQRVNPAEANRQGMAWRADFIRRVKIEFQRLVQDYVNMEIDIQKACSAVAQRHNIDYISDADCYRIGSQDQAPEILQYLQSH